MQRYAEIRSKRERVFYKNRMAGNRERQLEADKKLVEENQHLLPMEYRTLEQETMVAVPALEEEMDVDLEENMELDAQKKVKSTVKVSRKLKMKVGGGFEAE
jgi:large subunit ribosomal protein L24e